jgi:hypothetical protein
VEELGPRDEVPLSGGRITDGVVRIRNSVRRPSKATSPIVRSLLSHLERKGFSAVPRYLGADEQGRDILTYIPGSVGKWQFYPDETISLAGRPLRAFHDATVGCESLLGKPVMCHHDPAPNNVVFQGTRPIAFIDFDMIAPGERLEDLGYMAWSWCISSKASRQPIETQARQLGIGVTPPFVKNCTLRPGITRKTGVNPTSHECSLAGPRSDQDRPAGRAISSSGTIFLRASRLNVQFFTNGGVTPITRGWAAL